jgi:hypothetical protein
MVSGNWRMNFRARRHHVFSASALYRESQIAAGFASSQSSSALSSLDAGTGVDFKIFLERKGALDSATWVAN